MAVDTKGKSRKQLEKMRDDIDKAIKKLAAQDQKAARTAAEKAAKQHGFSLEELVGGAKPARKPKAKSTAPKGKPMYRNPADAKQTWTGKGRKPNWFIAALDSGKSENDLKI